MFRQKIIAAGYYFFGKAGLKAYSQSSRTAGSGCDSYWNILASARIARTHRPDRPHYNRNHCPHRSHYVPASPPSHRSTKWFENTGLRTPLWRCGWRDLAPSSLAHLGGVALALLCTQNKSKIRNQHVKLSQKAPEVKNVKCFDNGKQQCKWLLLVNWQWKHQFKQRWLKFMYASKFKPRSKLV